MPEGTCTYEYRNNMWYLRENCDPKTCAHPVGLNIPFHTSEFKVDGEWVKLAGPEVRVAETMEEGRVKVKHPATPDPGENAPAAAAPAGGFMVHRAINRTSVEVIC